MKKEKLSVQNYKVKPAFRDARGEIFDLIEAPVGHVGLITFLKGAVRGRHYHKKSVQYSYIISGKLKLAVSDLKGVYRRSFTIGPGTVSVIQPHIIHTYTAITDAVMLDLTTLARTSKDYEKDTVRVSK